MALRYLTAGESHGPQLTAILEGCPAGVPVGTVNIDRDLARRQLGYGRGERMRIERDRVRVVGGIRYGVTTGAPVALVVENRDAPAWGETLAVDRPAERAASVSVPRPGHADLGGALLYGHADLRDVIERASARETAARVACGAVARRLLAELGCTVHSHVVALGGVQATAAPASADDFATVDDDPVRCLDGAASSLMRAAIDEAAGCGDTLGGVFEVIAYGVPVGLGTYAHADRRLGSRLAAAVMSIPAVKGVELGAGFAAAGLPGSRVHDGIVWNERSGYGRASNSAGGVEGGMSTGEPVVLRAAMKPIATLRAPLDSVVMQTHEATPSRFERSDVCAVPAAAVVAEAVVALTLADAALERFGGACLQDVLGAARLMRERMGRA